MGLDFEISQHDRENLLRVCCEHGLPPKAALRLERAAGFLKVDELELVTKSAAQRRRELCKVAALARELNESLQALEFDDRAAIHREFKLRPVRLTLDPPDPVREVFAGAFLPHGPDLICENVLLLGDAALTLAGVAEMVADGIEGDGAGRPPRLDRLAMGVHRVAEVAALYRLRVGRGGAFHAICEAVFLAAGLNVDPDNAIRRYMQRFSVVMNSDQ